MQKTGRRWFPGRTSCFLLAALLLLFPLSLPTPSQKASASAEAPLIRLMRGNACFVKGVRRPADYKRERRRLVDGQQPYATILSCSDSRVPPELVFDESLGKIFVVRVAGNVIDLITLGSIEYAAEHLHSPLLLVLGHESCGAVEAAVEGGHFPPGIEAIVRKIEPAVAIARRKHPNVKDILPYAVVENIELQTRSVLDQSEVLRHMVENKELRIATGEYWLRSGRVDILSRNVEGSRH
jgi:carbonic anhydrase